MIVESTARDGIAGKLGLVVGATTGLPSMVFAAIQGDWLPAYAGSATGIAGVLFWVWKQPEDRRIRQMTDAIAAMTVEIAGLREESKEARRELSEARKAAEDADAKAIAERTKLRVENEEFRVQLASLGKGVARVGAGVRRVEDIVTNPSATPDPDVAKGGI